MSQPSEQYLKRIEQQFPALTKVKYQVPGYFAAKGIVTGELTELMNALAAAYEAAEEQEAIYQQSIEAVHGEVDALKRQMDRLIAPTEE